MQLNHFFVDNHIFTFLFIFFCVCLSCFLGTNFVLLFRPQRIKAERIPVLVLSTAAIPQRKQVKADWNIFDHFLVC